MDEIFINGAILETNPCMVTRIIAKGNGMDAHWDGYVRCGFSTIVTHDFIYTIMEYKNVVQFYVRILYLYLLYHAPFYLDSTLVFFTQFGLPIRICINLFCVQIWKLSSALYLDGNLLGGMHLCILSESHHVSERVQTYFFSLPFYLYCLGKMVWVLLWMRWKHRPKFHDLVLVFNIAFV